MDKEVTDEIMIEILSANPITNTIAYCTEIKDESVKRELIGLANEIKKVTIEEEQSSAGITNVIIKSTLFLKNDTLMVRYRLR